MQPKVPAFSYFRLVSTNVIKSLKTGKSDIEFTYDCEMKIKFKIKKIIAKDSSAFYSKAKKQIISNVS